MHHKRLFACAIALRLALYGQYPSRASANLHSPEGVLERWPGADSSTPAE